MPFWNIKPALHTNGVMRYRIFLNGRSYCSGDTRGGWRAVAARVLRATGWRVWGSRANASPPAVMSLGTHLLLKPCCRLPGGALLQDLGVSLAQLLACFGRLAHARSGSACTLVGAGSRGT